MEIRDCLPLMTKIYLSRIVDSIFKENIPKGSEDQLIERIDQNSEYLSNPKRVREALNLKQMPRTHRILTHCTLSQLLEQNELAATAKTVKRLFISILNEIKHLKSTLISGLKSWPSNPASRRISLKLHVHSRNRLLLTIPILGVKWLI